MGSRNILNIKQVLVLLCYEREMMGNSDYREFLGCLEIPSLGKGGYYLLNTEAQNKILGIASILEEFEFNGYHPKADDVIRMLSVLVADMNGILSEEISVNAIVEHVIKKYRGIYSDKTFKKCEAEFNNRYLGVENVDKYLKNGTFEYNMSEALVNFCSRLLGYFNSDTLYAIKVSLDEKRIICYCKDKFGTLFEGIHFEYSENSVVDWNGNFLEDLVGCVNDFDKEVRGLCKSVLISHNKHCLSDKDFSTEGRYRGSLCDGLFLVNL